LDYVSPAKKVFTDTGERIAKSRLAGIRDIQVTGEKARLLLLMSVLDSAHIKDLLSLGSSPNKLLKCTT